MDAIKLSTADLVSLLSDLLSIRGDIVVVANARWSNQKGINHRTLPFITSGLVQNCELEFFKDNDDLLKALSQIAAGDIKKKDIIAMASETLKSFEAQVMRINLGLDNRLPEGKADLMRAEYVTKPKAEVQP